MGMQETIAFSTGIPQWPAIDAATRSAGLPLFIRMIDNLPAFPDEVPEEGWKELRVASSNGMMTLRQTKSGLDCIVWGNAEQALQSDWRRLIEVLQKLAE
jgi:hypothetical protein